MTGTTINRNPSIPSPIGLVKIISGMWIILFYAMLLVLFDVSNPLDYKDIDVKDCTGKNGKDLQFLDAI